MCTCVGRGRGVERGRGGYRAGRGGGRGSYFGRGGNQQSSSQFGGNMASNVWDNSQAAKLDSNKEWTNPEVASIDDIPEDTDWVRLTHEIMPNFGTSMLGRRGELTCICIHSRKRIILLRDF